MASTTTDAMRDELGDTFADIMARVEDAKLMVADSVSESAAGLRGVSRDTRIPSEYRADILHVLEALADWQKATEDFLKAEASMRAAGKL